MSQVTEQSVRFQTALASIKLIQASAVLDLTEDDFDFLTSNKVWIATDRSRARSEERFSRNAETELVCRLLLEKKNSGSGAGWSISKHHCDSSARSSFGRRCLSIRPSIVQPSWASKGMREYCS